LTTNFTRPCVDQISSMKTGQLKK